MIDPKWLGLSIVGIVQSLIKEKHSQIIIDGKVIKATDAIKTIEKMMNIVIAYTNQCLMRNIWMKQIEIVNMKYTKRKKKVMEELKEEHVQLFAK